MRVRIGVRVRVRVKWCRVEQRGLVLAARGGQRLKLGLRLG